MAGNRRSRSYISRRWRAQARTYEGGVEQAFFSERLIFRTSFFHNEFGRQIEYVGLDLVPQLLPNLTPAQQNALEADIAGGWSV
jgi:vitamin B12 transporter